MDRKKPLEKGDRLRYSDLSADLVDRYEDGYTIDEITDQEIHADIWAATGADDFDLYDTEGGAY